MARPIRVSACDFRTVQDAVLHVHRVHQSLRDKPYYDTADHLRHLEGWLDEIVLSIAARAVPDEEMAA